MSERLTPQREAEIAMRDLIATKGPWGLYESGTMIDVVADLEETGCGYRARREIARFEDEPLDNDPTHREWTAEEDWEQVRIDAEFVAHARTDVPALLAELSAVRAERDSYRERALDAENRSTADGREVCADCGRPVPDGPCGVHSPDAVFQRAAREASQLRAERDAARARVAELENALAAAGRSLSSFIFDSDDPGADALGAQWLYHQAMPQADDPFAQPRAFRSSVFSEAAKTVEEMDGRPTDGEYSREYLNGYSHGLEDAAERLEKRADQAAEGSEAVS